MQYVKDGVIFKNPLHTNGRIIFNPTHQELIAAGYTVKINKTTIRAKEIKFSKLKIIDVLGDRWTSIKKKIEELGFYDRFNQATYLGMHDKDFQRFFQSLSLEEKKLLVQKCQY